MGPIPTGLCSAFRICEAERLVKLPSSCSQVSDEKWDERVILQIQEKVG
jgi:hypothetical protein